MKIINILFCVIFILFSAILIGCFSTVDHDWMIGEEGVNTVCDVVNTFVVNDDRTLMAPLCFIFLLPFMFLFVVKGVKGFSKNRWQSIAYFLTVISSIGYWYWMFFGRFAECPFPTQ
ncbi:DUF2645 family protein [Xenorhabdus sp. Reich]|uniref:DUF2645 family protein n=1 Tax=Xenorhabdus littoralis TaxID=2582835 RepID=A0ABU4SNM7_9GAMM|nr:DUF2645 family protein [Xenorhabdus sp. Reich]MDX8000269.1 DUF2645 family protein [Xenorhabdus sp. Reich]